MVFFFFPSLFCVCASLFLPYAAGVLVPHAGMAWRMHVFVKTVFSSVRSCSVCVDASVSVGELEVCGAFVHQPTQTGSTVNAGMSLT